MAEFNQVNLADIYGNIDRARANQAAMEANRRQQEFQNYQISRQMRGDQREDAVRGSYAVGQDGALDENRTLANLLKADPLAAMKFKQDQATAQQNAIKQKSETTKAELENRKATAAYLRDRLAGVQDQATYDAVMSEAAELGAGFINGAPREFNPEFVRKQLFTADEFLKQSTPKYEKVDLGGKIQVIDVNPMTNPSIKGTSLDKTATISERESMRHNRVAEGISGAQLGLSKERLAFDKAGGGANKAPAGYRFLPDGSLEAIKGGPADIKAGELGAKTEARKQMQLGTTANTIEAVDTALKQAGFLETGMTGALMSKVAGSDAYNLRRTAETIKANLGFNELQAMREASPTGGALGAIAVQELTALQSTIANIDPNQSQEQLKANLKKVRKHVNAWRKTLGGQEIPEPKDNGQLPRGATRPTVFDDADRILQGQ